jgi:endoglucanase Acf2
MRVIFALRMKPFVLDDWQQLPLPGKLVGNIGQPTSHLWDSIRTYNQQLSNNEFAASQDSPSTFAQDTMDKDDRYRLQQLQAQLLPLGRRYPWPSDTTQQRS